MLHNQEARTFLSSVASVFFLSPKTRTKTNFFFLENCLKDRESRVNRRHTFSGMGRWQYSVRLIWLLPGLRTYCRIDYSKILNQSQYIQRDRRRKGERDRMGLEQMCNKIIEDLKQHIETNRMSSVERTCRYPQELYKNS